MRFFIAVLLTTIASLHFWGDKIPKLVCVESSTVEWIGVCNRHARCVVGFENGRIDKSVIYPYIGEKRCIREEFMND